MFPNRRGTEMPVVRRSCNSTTSLFPYGPPNEAPFPSASPPLLRPQPEFQYYDPPYFQTPPNYMDNRPRGFVDRSSRMMPMGFDGGMHSMPSIPSHVRTVPTSITIPPSKQRLAHATKLDDDPNLESSSAAFPFQTPPPTNYLPSNPVTLNDTPMGSFDHSHTPPVHRAAIIRYCALALGHCTECKTDDCWFRDSCKRVKYLWRHMAGCSLRECCVCAACSCYPIKKEISHFRNCQSPQCWSCSTLRQMIKDVSQQSSRSRQLNRGGPDYTVGSMLMAERSIRPSPVRKPHFASSLDEQAPFSSMDAVKQEYIDYDATGTRIYQNTSPGLFVDTADVFDNTFRQNKRREETPLQLGTSLFDTFDPNEIEAYLKAVRGCDSLPSKPDEGMKDKICAVCLQGEQTFQPIQVYCDSCFARIKRGGMYWKTKMESNIQICTCHKCFSAKKNGTLVVGQLTLSQAIFRSCKNNECVTETWVACDKCGYWVHSSCGLFNRGENNDNAKYMCPFCLKEEMERGYRVKPACKPVSMWGAEELAECPLSEHIQSKVNDAVLNHLLELQTGANPPSIQLLTIRVVTATRRVTKVQPIFSSSFPDAPKEYPYHQKVIGVFQKIHGVDVLIFCMYVQEYGDDCMKPNQRWVNLEYIDSVKHFTPDVKTVRGESLRSVVYKETLLAYIEFVKYCGFEVFYIWACPPGKEGDDYILHCKPKNQRIPSADRLRVWYKDLLKTAKERSIVTHDSNLMDTFFACGMDRAIGRPFNAAEMPYFEGDYWPGEAEKILRALGTSKGIDYCRKSGEKRKTRGEMSLNESLENGLMVSLPFPRWSDFMVWHLQEPCSLCQTYITSGSKFVYHFENNINSSTTANNNNNTTSSSSTNNNTVTSSNQKSTEPATKKRAHFEGIKLGRQGGAHSNTQFFQICETCYQTCEVIDEGGPIPECVNFKDLQQEEVASVTSNVGDFNNSEESRFSEIFESRQTFLAFCKGNHYQFDTLQHAKHSTMMLLYHLHNTKAPVFPTLCRGCAMEIPIASDGVVPTPELCRSCQAAGIMETSATPSRPSPVLKPTTPLIHPHNDTRPHLFRHQDSFEHAAYCTNNLCHTRGCSQMKDIFDHVRHCKVRAGGLCQVCRFFTLFVKRHADFCNRPCCVPECERIKAIRKQQMRLDQAQRSRVYCGEASGSSSSS